MTSVKDFVLFLAKKHNLRYYPYIVGEARIALMFPNHLLDEEPNAILNFAIDCLNNGLVVTTLFTAGKMYLHIFPGRYEVRREYNFVIEGKRCTEYNIIIRYLYHFGWDNDECVISIKKKQADKTESYMVKLPPMPAMTSDEALKCIGRVSHKSVRRKILNAIKDIEKEELFPLCRQCLSAQELRETFGGLSKT